MSNLDVSLRLKLISDTQRGRREAERDIQGIANAAKRLNGTGGGEKLARDLGRIGANADKAEASMRRLNRTHQTLGNEGRFGAGALAGAGMRAFLPLGGAFAAKKAFDQAVQWNTAWAEVRKKVNDGDEEGFQALEKTLRRLSLDLGIARSEMAGLTAEAGAAGIAYKDLERFMVLTSKAANGWDMAPREASEKLAGIKAGTGYTIDQMAVLADKINALGDNSNAKERDIVEMFGRVGAAAREAGVDVDSTLAILTGVRSGGMETEVTARWFGALTGGLRTAADAPKRVERGLKMLGLTAKKVSEGMKKDGAGTLIDLFERLEKSPKAVEAAVAIFGREWWDETMRAKGGLAEVRKQLEFIRDPKNYAGSLDKSWDVQAKTANIHLKRSQELVSRIGEALSSWTLAPFNAAVDSVIAKMRDLDERASLWERWTKAEEARLKALGVIQPVGPEEQGPPMPPGRDDAPQWMKSIRKAVYGDERTADVVFQEWLFGKPGQKEGQLKDAEGSGQAAAKAEQEARIRRLLEHRQRLGQMIGDSRYPDQEGMRTRAASMDEQLKAMLGSADLGPIAREVMEKYTAGIRDQGESALAAARDLAAKLQGLLNFTATPTISPQFAPSGGGGDTSGMPAAPLPPRKPKKMSSAGPRVHVAQTNHFHGVQDVAGMHRELQRAEDRAVREARGRALFDTGAVA